MLGSRGPLQLSTAVLEGLTKVPGARAKLSLETRPPVTTGFTSAPANPASLTAAGPLYLTLQVLSTRA